MEVDRKLIFNFAFIIWFAVAFLSTLSILINHGWGIDLQLILVTNVISFSILILIRREIIKLVKQ